MPIYQGKAPFIMGIMNLTTDSFYFESREHSNQYISEEYIKADIVDIGCESSRPGATPISEENELKKLYSILDKVKHCNQILSIDTYKPSVARLALENGFSMVNDICAGGINNKMLELAAEYDCSIVLMHMKGFPQNMQDNPYYDDVIDEIISFFVKKLSIADKLGINPQNIILDPGIGFGKRVEDNDRILRNLDQIKKLGYKVLLGLSRKSFLSIDQDGPESRLPATLGATVIAIQKGVDILRVHDVDATFKVISIINRITNNMSEYSEILYN